MSGGRERREDGCLSEVHCRRGLGAGQGWSPAERTIPDVMASRWMDRLVCTGRRECHMCDILG